MVFRCMNVALKKFDASQARKMPYLEDMTATLLTV